jgi:hypothetical protein
MGMELMLMGQTMGPYKGVKNRTLVYKVARQFADGGPLKSVDVWGKVVLCDCDRSEAPRTHMELVRAASSVGTIIWNTALRGCATVP